MLHRVSFLASESVRKFLYYFAIKKGNLSFGSFPTLSRLFQASLRWHYPNQVMGRRLFLPLSLQDKLPFVFTCKFNYIPLCQKWQDLHSANPSSPPEASPRNTETASPTRANRGSHPRPRNQSTPAQQAVQTAPSKSMRPFSLHPPMRPVRSK